MASKDDETARLRSQLQRKNDEVQLLLTQLREKESLISELNSTIELLRIGLGHSQRPRLRGIGISAEPASTTNIDTKLVYHGKPQRFYADILVILVVVVVVVCLISYSINLSKQSNNIAK